MINEEQTGFIVLIQKTKKMIKQLIWSYLLIFNGIKNLNQNRHVYFIIELEMTSEYMVKDLDFVKIAYVYAVLLNSS